MTPALERAERACVAAGVITLTLGTALLVAPRRIGDVVGVRAGRSLRGIGLLDVVIAVGRLRGRPRWPWLAARAAANPPTAAYLAVLGRRSGAKAPLAIAAFLLGATVADARAVRVLHAEQR